MRCDKCDACMVTEYAESLEQDFECLCGVGDNNRIDNQKGELGCNIHYTKVRQTIFKDSE